MLKDLINFMDQNKTKDIIVAGDFNQSLYSKDIESFLINNGLFEIHDLLNSNKTSRRDNIYIIGFKCIDFMVAISGVINFIEDYKLINYNQIILNFNINLFLN